MRHWLPVHASPAGHSLVEPQVWNDPWNGKTKHTKSVSANCETEHSHPVGQQPNSAPQAGQGVVVLVVVLVVVVVVEVVVVLVVVGAAVVVGGAQATAVPLPHSPGGRHRELPLP